MVYEKQTWQTGEVITEEKLNHAEEGIDGAYEAVANVLPQNTTGDAALLMSTIDDDVPVVNWSPMALMPFPLAVGEGLDDGDTLSEDQLAALNAVIASGGFAYLISTIDSVQVYFYLSAKDVLGGKVTFESGSQYNGNYYFEIALATGAVSRKGGII